MIRLIELGLMFGNLYRVDSQVQVARYNRAMKQLTGRETGLTDFHVDISGFSPEIGDELGDDRYLNHNGCNRQFILLSTDQASSPLLNAQFSTNREILKRFIEENRTILDALLARDAFAGELENSVFAIDNLEHLLRHRRITIVGDTTGNLVEQASSLEATIARFEDDADAWKDDALLARIVEGARVCGDIRRHPLKPGITEFPCPDFWTSHLGGAYVFSGIERPVVVARDPGKVGRNERAEVIGLDERSRLARFLSDRGLVENLFAVRKEKAIRILRQKMDFILIGCAAEQGLFSGGVSRREINALPRLLGADLPDSFRALQEVMSWAEHGGEWPEIDSTHPAFFYLLRAAAGPNRDLVNMLLSELCPRDAQKMFIFHKHLFYSTYNGWTDAKKTFVSNFLAKSYAMNKKGIREDLFGHEPQQEDTAAS